MGSGATQCVDAYGGTDSDVIDLWDCKNSSSYTYQSWKIEYEGNGYHKIKSRVDGKSMDLIAGHMNDNAEIKRYPQQGANPENQLWSFHQVKQ